MSDVDMSMLNNLVFIEVQAYGDFDMVHTVGVWAGFQNRMQLVSEFCGKHGLESEGKEVIRAVEADSRKLTDLTNKLESFLKSHGFKKVKTQALRISD